MTVPMIASIRDLTLYPDRVRNHFRFSVERMVRKENIFNLI